MSDDTADDERARRFGPVPEDVLMEALSDADSVCSQSGSGDDEHDDEHNEYALSALAQAVRWQKYRIRELETKLREQGAKDTNDYAQLRAENRDLTEALTDAEGLELRIETLTNALRDARKYVDQLWFVRRTEHQSTDDLDAWSAIADKDLAYQPTSKPEVCTWKLDTSGVDAVLKEPHTGEEFPEMGFKLCPYCGKPIHINEEDT